MNLFKLGGNKLKRKLRAKSDNRAPPANAVSLQDEPRNSQHSLRSFEERRFPLDSKFETTLESCVEQLQNDFVSGARGLADNALCSFSTLFGIAATSAEDGKQLFNMMTKAAKRLCYARPAMSSAITSCLLRALQRIQEACAVSSEEKIPTNLATVAQTIITTIQTERSNTSMRVGTQFTEWFKDFYIAKPGRGLSKIRILTLSNSSSIRTAILALLEHVPAVEIGLIILESRPRFEGATMAVQILESVKSTPHRERLKIHMAPDCAVATLAREIDMVLLGADRIAHDGAVSNKIGSSAAAICARSWNKKVQVVVVSDSDKIAAGGEKLHPEEKHDPREITKTWNEAGVPDLEGEVRVFGEWFEWVDPGFVDVYVTEAGVMRTEDIKRVAGEMEDLEKTILGV
ncbi:hypothetical protein BCR34DRAFT_607915 [Clohesyomyces aquaticus]|uniref:Nagb/rpia/CoA transferase-like protein n=1 Tax=Clohesyomyces aquaticus TaxID=1231657 RepID=A0A1Y1YCU4_9PLEO|nr:hypothetical protein BCR34DRAFT_607915 [Clohesyomyces aquaticus]